MLKKDKKYTTEDLLEFAAFVRDNSYTSGSPNYHPYSSNLKSGDLDYVFICWLEETKREL